MKHSEYVAEITAYDQEFEPWKGRGRKIVKRYKDIRGSSESGRKYNILYSNVQTLLPAYFSRSPNPDIERRFKDKDDVGRLAAEIWERSVNYFITQDKFRHNVKQAVLDRLLPGRGVVWVRYVPHFKDVQVVGNQEVQDDGVEITEDTDESEPLQDIAYEEVIPDYVYWEDFGHNVARSWDEVFVVWRIVYLTKDEGIERFGEIFNEVPLDYSPKNLSDAKIEDNSKKAIIYEMWNKKEKKAVWIHKDFEEILDERDDPLGLDDFYPCPRPLFPTMTNDSLVPIPDYTQYQDQAKELDDLTGRIFAITKAIKVAGVYDASASGVANLLSEGVENQLIPVQQWAVFGDKGGLKGVIDLMPMQEILQTLLGLYEARDKVKQDLYEITGIADIIRGATKASETATAQSLKGKYAALRLDDGQNGVQRFCRELTRIFAQIIANHFQLDTIKAISGIKLLTNAEKQQVQMQFAPPPQMPGQPPAPLQPIPEELQELMAQPSWEEVYALLKDNAMRCFRIDIETDSTMKADQEAEKASRVEFLTAVSTFMEKAMPIAQATPQMTPLLMDMLMFGVRGFPTGKQLETTFEMTQQKLIKLAESKENAPPQLDPAQQKIQADMQIAQAKSQADQQAQQARMQADIQIEQARQQSVMQIEQAKLQISQQESQQRIQLEREEMLGRLQLQREEMLGRLDIERQKIQMQPTII